MTAPGSRWWIAPINPHTKHPGSHTDEDIKHIENYIRGNPNITMLELYAKLKFSRGYRRHPVLLFRILRKLGYYKDKAKQKKSYIPRPYDTPDRLGAKWQLDVKQVPKSCYTDEIPDKFYQYTVIDEAAASDSFIRFGSIAHIPQCCL